MSKLEKSDNQKPKSACGICAIFCPQATVDSTTTVVSTLHLLEPLTQDIFAITGNFPEDAVTDKKIHIINVGITHYDSTQSPMVVRAFRFLSLQLKMSYHLFRIAGRIDILFLAGGAEILFLPALLARLLRKRIILLRHGTDYFQTLSKTDYYSVKGRCGRCILSIMDMLIGLTHRLADRLAVFTSDITDPRLKRYQKKTVCGVSRFYVDVDSFKVEKNLDSRENLVGYIGRFKEIKGAMNFVKAIPLVLKESTGVKILIAGDGEQSDEIKKEIKDANIGDKVTLTGWIPHDRLPQNLNRIRLLVIPSYAEAGPHMVFEAMACGTPVLAAPVGIMPDVVKDGETGFIMGNNSPECIAQNIIRALNHPNLGQIAGAARRLMEREYTHEAAVERYRKILAGLK